MRYARTLLLATIVCAAGCGRDTPPPAQVVIAPVADKKAPAVATPDEKSSTPKVAGPTAELLAAYTKGGELLRAGKYREAAEQLDAAIDLPERETGFAEAYMLRALAFERLGRIGDARKDIAKAESIFRIQKALASVLRPGDAAVVVRRAQRWPADSDSPGEPCCDLMASDGGPKPQFLEVGTAVTLVHDRGKGLVEYKTAPGTPQLTGLVEVRHLAAPVSPGVAVVTLPASRAGDALEHSFAAFEYLHIEVNHGTGENGTPVTLSVSAYGTKHPVLSDGVAPRWRTSLPDAAAWHPLADRIDREYPFFTSYTDDGKGDETGRVVIWLSYPRPWVIPVGSRGRHVLLSQNTQRYLSLGGGSQGDYRPQRFALIIQEQHNNPDGHERQLQGLESFFADNPWLLEDRAVSFLSEGSLKGTEVDVAPLIRVEPKPSDVLIREILGTFLIPGYAAYEWKHAKGIPIKGYEDPDLYRISARLFTGSFERPIVARKLWWQAVIARNKTMADGLVRELDRRECPLLFMGGRHVTGLDKSEENPDWNSLKGVIPPGDVEVIRKIPRRGVEDWLRDAKVGWTFLNVREPLFDSFAYNATRPQYFELFAAQAAGNLDPYIARYALDACPTTRPDAEAAARAAERIRRLLRQYASAPLASPLPGPYINTRFTINMTGAPAGSSTNAAGFARNGPWFWRQMLNHHPQLFSQANRTAIAAGRSPVVDATWVAHNPTHQTFMGSRLIHHHINQREIATGLPERVHRAWHGVLHSIR